MARARLSGTWTIIVTTDCTDPFVYGPFKSEAEAKSMKDRVWEDWADEHSAQLDVTEMYSFND